jgi:serine/threonine protein kinase
MSFLVDPFADTLELPISGALEPFSATWEHEQIVAHVGAHFQIVREIGRGGMGVVFLARDIALHRLVAIKVLRQEFASSEEHRERFRREARMTARLSHPNIVPVHSFGEMADDPTRDPLVYIVMKYVHGESLAERMRREGKIPARWIPRAPIHSGRSERRTTCLPSRRRGSSTSTGEAICTRWVCWATTC